MFKQNVDAVLVMERFMADVAQVPHHVVQMWKNNTCGSEHFHQVYFAHLANVGVSPDAYFTLAAAADVQLLAACTSPGGNA